MLWSIRGPYQTIWSSPLTNAKWHSVVWPNTMTTLHRQDFIPICDLFIELDLISNNTRFRWVWHAERERLLPPVTWSYPFWDSHLFIKTNPTLPTYEVFTEPDHFTKLDITELERCQQNTWDGCGMPAGDADSPDTWSHPFWDLHMFYLLRPIIFPNLSLFFRTMLFEHPSILSQFCLLTNSHILYLKGRQSH